jgi:LAO/AO transport system kinase
MIASGFVDRLRSGDKAVLARAITIVENNRPQASTILRAINGDLGSAHVVGFTGPPGAGKSTLVNAYIKVLRARDKRVAVAAVDPTSPLSGGAILGDRIRMGEHIGDDGVFVRSLASRGQTGGLSAATARVIDVMDASGADVIIVETVGAGQSEVEISDIADTRVVLNAPGLGDNIQAIKAGILEIGDILVVNKADLPLAETTQQQLRAMLDLREVRDDEWCVPVLLSQAVNGKGIEELADAIERHYHDIVAARGRPDPKARVRRLIADNAAKLVRQHYLGNPTSALCDLADAVQRGELDLDGAAKQLLKIDN